MDNVTGVASNLIMRGRATNLLGTKNNIEAKEEGEESLYDMMSIKHWIWEILETLQLHF